jgi:hypothetical protein
VGCRPDHLSHSTTFDHLSSTDPASDGIATPTERGAFYNSCWVPDIEFFALSASSNQKEISHVQKSNQPVPDF